MAGFETNDIEELRILHRAVEAFEYDNALDPEEFVATMSVHERIYDAIVA